MVDTKKVVRMIKYSRNLAAAEVVILEREFAGITGARRAIERTAASRTRGVVGTGGGREIHVVTTDASRVAGFELDHLVERADENKSLIRQSSGKNEVNTLGENGRCSMISVPGGCTNGIDDIKVEESAESATRDVCLSQNIMKKRCKIERF